MYIVKVSRVKSDKNQKAFFRGDTVTDDDFPKEVILDWLLIGVLEREPEKETKRRRYAVQDKSKKPKGSTSKEKQSLGEGEDTPNG